jgi:hypothetical protein
LDTRLDVDHRADASFDAVVIEMTKSAQIMELYAQGLSTREIADKVGCLIEYVRVVARQRRGGPSSPADIRYRSSTLGQVTSLRNNARDLTLMRTGDKAAASKAGKAVYSAMRDSGASVVEANKARQRIKNSILRNTGAKDAATRAYFEAVPNSEQQHVS